nr:MAG TPA: hypothetical protein [Caudoviricetes sp.]
MLSNNGLCVFPLSDLPDVDGIKVARKSGEMRYIVMDSLCGYPFLVIFFCPRNTPLRNPNGEWASDHLRRLSLVCAKLQSDRGCATAIVTKTSDVKAVMDSYRNGDINRLRFLTNYSSGNII